MNRNDRIPRVLVVDDEADIRELLDMTLTRLGLEADCVASLKHAYEALENTPNYRLCLSDMKLPDGLGIELVSHISERFPQIPVAVITAFGSMDNAVEALKAGAFDYVSKPITVEQVRLLAQSAARLTRTPNKSTTLGNNPYQLLGNSPAIVHVRNRIEKVARSQAPVFISGESGSGKELAARSIHELSPRHHKSFIAVNCGAIPDNLMESEFFGYRKGAFTGAQMDKDGFFQAASGGTLFLDEIADLPLSMQVKLLRAIQERKVRKVGAITEDQIDVRLISATHHNLLKCVENGQFRHDLYYRVHVIDIHMPSLRECVEDITLLVDSILERLAHRVGIATPRIEASTLKALQQYPFPGNVRELENMLERALALFEGEQIQAGDLQIPSRAAAKSNIGQENKTSQPVNLQDHLDQVERDAIMSSLQGNSFNAHPAACELGITIRSLHARMERLNIQFPEK